MGGEKAELTAAVISAMGSPPRGRGKGHGCHQTAVVVGITPAWAGKRSQVAAALQSGWDHPRVGGEKCRGAPAATLPPGSPPHGRGKAFSVLRRQFRFRITPAWAGKRSSGPAFPSPRWNHPRMGGEKYDCTGQEFTNWGSPPRRRGKDRRLVVDVLPEGITPAWAGKSLASQPWSPPLWMMVIRPRP